MTTTPTPRTYALLESGKAHYMSVSLCRQLERELAASQELVRQYKEVADSFKDLALTKDKYWTEDHLQQVRDTLEKLEALNQSVKDAEI